MNFVDLNAEIAAHIRRQNAAPLADFNGISPEQMHQLVRQPLEGTGPVRLQAALPDAVLDQVPFLRLTEELLRVVQREGRIKLTAGGALPRKVVHELYGHGIERSAYIDDGTGSLNREADWSLLHTAHMVAIMAGLLKKVHGSLTLTKTGTGLLAPAQRPALLRAVLVAYTSKLNWGYHDNFDPSASFIGQFAWLFSVYLLARFGTEQLPADFYADQFLLAFPHLCATVTDLPYMSAEYQVRGAYTYRFYGRFGEWFGISKFTSRRWQPQEQPDQVVVRPLLAQLFWVAEELLG